VAEYTPKLKGPAKREIKKLERKPAPRTSIALAKSQSLGLCEKVRKLWKRKLWKEEKYLEASNRHFRADTALVLIEDSARRWN
jgi:hypothetical protein